jgi:hypothetical protein
MPRPNAGEGIELPIATDHSKNFADGRVMVSCGLLAEIRVDGKYGTDDIAAAKGDVVVAVRVLAASWATADRVELYANGVKIHETAIEDKGRAGEKWAGKY